MKIPSREDTYQGNPLPRVHDVQEKHTEHLLEVSR